MVDEDGDGRSYVEERGRGDETCQPARHSQNLHVTSTTYPRFPPLACVTLRGGIRVSTCFLRLLRLCSLSPSFPIADYNHSTPPPHAFPNSISAFKFCTCSDSNPIAHYGSTFSTRYERTQ